MEVSGQISRPGCCMPGEKAPGSHWVVQMGRFQNWYGRGGEDKKTAPARNRTSAVKLSVCLDACCLVSHPIIASIHHYACSSVFRLPLWRACRRSCLSTTASLTKKRSWIANLVLRHFLSFAAGLLETVPLSVEIITPCEWGDYY
jgi:hypothetical protein